MNTKKSTSFLQSVIKRKTLSYILLIIPPLVAFTIYIPALHHEFLNWDDAGIVTSNLLIRNFTLKGLFSLFNLHSGVHLPLSEYVPVTLLSYALEYRVFELNPFVYHFTNVLLHCLNTIGVCAFIFLLTRNRICAFLTALFFAVQPLHVEAVVWISARKDVLSTFFCLLSLISYTLARKYRSSTTAFLPFFFFIAAVLSKPNCVILPLLLILIDWFLYNDNLFHAAMRKVHYFIVSIIITLIAVFGQHSSEAIAPLNGMIWRNILVACRGVTFYIQKTIVPTGLSGVYPQPVDVSFAHPIYALAFFFSCALLLLIFLFHKTKKQLIFAILFYIIALLPVLQLLPVGVQISAADRFFYLPSIGPLFLLSLLIYYIAKKYRYWISISLVILFTGGWIYATEMRIPVWKNSGTFWHNVINSYPQFALAYNSFGSYYYSQKQTNQATVYFHKALELDNSNALPYSNLSVIALSNSNVTEAVRLAKECIEREPDYSVGYFKLAHCYISRHDYDEAIMLLHKGLSLSPYNENQRTLLAMTYLEAGYTNNAIEQFEYILELNTRSTKPLVKLLNIYENLHNYEKVEEYSLMTLKRIPSYTPAWYTLGVAYHKLEKLEDAENAYKYYLETATEKSTALCNVALIQKARGKYSDAMNTIEKAYKYAPNNPEILYNYACIAAVAGKPELALEKLRNALALHPNLRIYAKDEKDFSSMKSFPAFEELVK